MTRLDDKKSGAVVMVMQRLHQDDLAGHVLEAGAGITSASRPIAEGSETIQLQNNVFRFREPGDLLHPEREPQSVLDQARLDHGLRRLLGPVPAEPVRGRRQLMLSATWLRALCPAYSPAWTATGSSSRWDCAIKAGDGHDFSSASPPSSAAAASISSTSTRDRLAFPDLRRAVESLAIEYRGEVLPDRRRRQRGPTHPATRERPPARRPVTRSRKPDRDKITRLAACMPAMEAGDLVLPEEAPWKDDFIASCSGFRTPARRPGRRARPSYLPSPTALPARRRARPVAGAARPSPWG